MAALNWRGIGAADWALALDAVPVFHDIEVDRSIARQPQNIHLTIEQFPARQEANDTRPGPRTHPSPGQAESGTRVDQHQVLNFTLGDMLSPVQGDHPAHGQSDEIVWRWNVTNTAANLLPDLRDTVRAGILEVHARARKINQMKLMTGKGFLKPVGKRTPV